MQRFDGRGVYGWVVRVRDGAVRVNVRDVLGGGIRRGLRGGVQGQGQLLRARAVRRDKWAVRVRGGVDGRQLLISVVQVRWRMRARAMQYVERCVRLYGGLVWSQVHDV